MVQPFLNQLVAFTRENLLIFVGQQPNAHWILTDQNQLSPVITQDAFPLFAHDKSSPSTDELEELLEKMMSPHVRLDDDFVDAVYGETGGHPFLTGKVLIAFWDWMIEQRYPVRRFPRYAPSCTTSSQPPASRRGLSRTATTTTLFKRAASDHLSPVGREADPWLHSVYSAMRGLVLNSPSTFSLPESQFEEMAERYSTVMSPRELLASAERANFLTLQNGLVTPKVRVFGQDRRRGGHRGILYRHRGPGLHSVNKAAPS